ncbi:MAG: hypothetical protein HWQ35_14235 [Nostoc sp. NMS1]|uniref:hypothetical protein n=1 Tax=unclassified Nostoc TaxID=2593658 RepID=UPI0025CE36D8|nr:MULTISPECIES: hypothetical protein [unclassified Nostoc]MBN3907667.1 hypothetical protein [Nostoc sp. NMS1]MBN3992954.1 hypothetical protein [Nostoc sp. NMS2]
MAIAWAGGGQSNVYSLPTVRLQAVGNALQVNYRLNRQWLSGSAIARHLTANQSIVRLHPLQFFRAKISAVDG